MGAKPPPVAAPRPGPMDRLKQAFEMDLRSLALLRVLLGGMILVDLAIRAQALADHYTDQGLLPRAIQGRMFIDPHPGRFSFHMYSGETSFQAVLFALAALCAVLLMAGYRTRLFLFLSWLLMVSLHNRNELIETGGDYLLRLACFFGLFLPLGARWSIDSVAQSGPRQQDDRVRSLATFAFTMQMTFVYVFSAWHKGHAHWTEDYLAIHYALHIDAYATPLGLFLRQFTEFNKFVTWGTRYFEFLAPYLIFGVGMLAALPGLARLQRFQGPVRTAGVLIFMVFHVGLGLALALGTFSWFAALIWTAMLPGWAWQRLFSRLETPERLGLRIYYDADCGFCRRVVILLRTFLLLPQTPILKCQDDPSIAADLEQHNSWVVVDAAGDRHYGYGGLTTVFDHSPLLRPLRFVYSSIPLVALGDRIYPWIATHRIAASRAIAFTRPRPLRVHSHWVMQALACVCIMYVALWNLRTVKGRAVGPYISGSAGSLIPDIRPSMQALRLDQHWGLFAPYPRTNDGWYVIVGHQLGGGEVDLQRHDDGYRLTWQKPKYVSSSYPTFRWRKYFRNIRRSSRRNKAQLPIFTTFLCNRWNAAHQGESRISDLDLYFMRMKTLRRGGHRGPMKKLLWHRTCRL